MKYIEFDNHLRASYSFAVEEYIMNSSKYDDEYFMFWRTKPCLMIGRFQNTIEEINQRFAHENNIEITRRNSGGGTVYTDLECWQFSFIIDKKKAIKQTFREFVAPVVDAVGKLGAEAVFNSRNDLICEGKKFSGNAQYTNNNYVLHHGTLLFNTNLDNLVLSLKVGDEKILSKGISSVRERVTNLKPHLSDKNISSHEFRDSIVKSIKGEMETIRLDSYDIEQIEKIEKKKFTTWDWNYGNSPEFNISRSKKLNGGKVEINLMVKKGKIEDCGIYGDFFSYGDINVIHDAVIGCNYEKKEIESALKKTNASGVLYQISDNELLSCFID